MSIVRVGENERPFVLSKFPDGPFKGMKSVQVVEDGEIYICAHSDDALDRPLSSYNNASERAVFIAGARTTPVYPCFDQLLRGVQ